MSSLLARGMGHCGAVAVCLLIAGCSLQNFDGLSGGDGAGNSGSGGLGSAMDPFISYAAGKDAGANGCAASAVAVMTAGTDSQSLATTVLNKDAQVTGDPTLSLTGKYGRLKALALDPTQGGLWVGTSNRDGIGTPGADDDRVLYIPPPQGGGQGGDVS